jgi:hypothetical protein
VTASAIRRKGATAPFPDTVDELVALLFDGLTSVDLLAEQRRTQDWRVARRGRPCRCERPIPLADEGWFGVAWVRCVLCGHDVWEGEG